MQNQKVKVDCYIPHTHEVLDHLEMVAFSKARVHQPFLGEEFEN
jgi:hypothetical protein